MENAIRNKIIPITVTLLIVSILSGCEETASMREADYIHQKAEAFINGTDEREITLDLTTMNDDMKYAKSVEMFANPADYVERKIRVNGSYSYVKDESTNKEYYAVVFSDKDGYNVQAIEFDPVSKEDLPQIEEDITVEGYYDIYYEGDGSYAILRAAQLIK